MNIGFLVRLFICIFIFSIYLYKYVDKQNQLTTLRLKIPPLSQEVRTLQEVNTKLQFEMNQFESPSHLMELLEKPEFGHLKYPSNDQIILIPFSSPKNLASPLKEKSE